jgi:MFS family permease
MLEAYAFLAAFTVQILVGAVLNAVYFKGLKRAKAKAQFPGRDGQSLDRFVSLYGVASTIIPVLGLVLLGWLFSHMRSPDWDIGEVIFPLVGYIVVQSLLTVVVARIGAWIRKKALLHSPPETKRTASLQRRGLFDIVSPYIVLCAVVGYVLFAAFVVHIHQRFGYTLLLDVTFVYALNAFLVYRLLYRQKRSPLVTRAVRMQAVEMQVKFNIYVSIAVVAFMTITATLVLLQLVRWAPFATSLYMVVIYLSLIALLLSLRRRAEADRLSLAPAS